MTLHTRQVRRHGYTGCAYSDQPTVGITLTLAPWESLPVETLPDRKPRPQEYKTVKTPVITRVRAACPDTFGANGEEWLAAAWRSMARREGHLPSYFHANSQKTADPSQAFLERRAAVLRHLMDGEDGRADCLRYCGMSDGGFAQSVLKALKDEGLITRRRGRDRVYLSITPAGRELMA